MHFLGPSLCSGSMWDTFHSGGKILVKTTDEDTGCRSFPNNCDWSFNRFVGKPSLVGDVEDFKSFMKLMILQGENVSSTPSSSSEQSVEGKTSSKCCKLKFSTKKSLNPLAISATELKQLSPRNIIWGKLWQERECRSLMLSEIKWVVEQWSKVILSNSTE